MSKDILSRRLSALGGRRNSPGGAANPAVSSARIASMVGASEEPEGILPAAPLGALPADLPAADETPPAAPPAAPLESFASEPPPPPLAPTAFETAPSVGLAMPPEIDAQGFQPSPEPLPSEPPTPAAPEPDFGNLPDAPPLAPDIGSLSATHERPHANFDPSDPEPNSDHSSEPDFESSFEPGTETLDAGPEERLVEPERSVAVDPFQESELDALKARMAARLAARTAGEEPSVPNLPEPAPFVSAEPSIAAASDASAVEAAPEAHEPATEPHSASPEMLSASTLEPTAPFAPPPEVAFAPEPPAPESFATQPIAPEAPAVPPQPSIAEPAPQADTADPDSPKPERAPPPPPVRVIEPELAPGQLMSFKPKERIQEERSFDSSAPRNRSAGSVIACTGNAAVIRATTGCYDTVTGEQWAVGRMLSIQSGGNRIVALIDRIETPSEGFDPEAEESTLIIHVELQGEVQDREDGTSKFAKGITCYPGIGATAHQIRASDLGAIYASTGSSTAEIGTLSQDASVPAFVEIEDMIAKHFAVLGSTGCGKSSSVSLLLHASQEIMPDLRVLILDPHNEYSCAFPDSTTITQESLDLPFWLFQLEEYVECLFRGKPVVQEEVDALREFLPKAKVRFRDGEERLSLRSQDNSSNAITADTPLPYRISDLLACLEDELGLLDSKMDKSVLKSLKNRIETHSNDPRFAFMFRHRTIEDVAAPVIGKLFALAPDTKGLTTILQMAGMPAEVVNAVASVLCRMAFELAIAAKGGMKILVVCEEAHRYVPLNAASAFGPTRRAIARIAKEGRKYGCFMSIISQRPAELDPTILSQCCTVFSLRLGNDADQEIIKKSISTGSASAITFLSSIGNREAIAFGEGFSTPMRMKFATLPVQWLPGQDSDVFGKMGGERKALELGPVLQAWRGGGH